MIEPCFIIEVSVSTPDELAIVLAGNETVISATSTSNAQENFISQPAISNDGVTKLDDPIVRKVSVRQRDFV